VGDELADVLIYAIELSMILGFDTEKLILNKLEKVKKKYPAKIVKKKGMYAKIKKVYREKKKS
jgi:NTP pyrophosphatase (non-canonical NTP hydrolase)